MRPRPLPSELDARAFSARQAQALGVSKGRLRSSGLVHPTRGGYCTSPPDDLLHRARVWAVAMPDARAFSHVTAALIHGLPLTRRLEELALAGTLHVMARTPDGRTDRPGVTGHRGLELRAVDLVDGLWVTSLADTWCDLATLGPRVLSVDDLVVIGDHVVRILDEGSDVVVRPGSSTSPGVRALHQALGQRVRPRGKVLLRQALDLIRPRVKSPMESRSRLMFVRAGFPEPEVNISITDDLGEWLAEGDLVWRDKRVVGEYQGAVHGEIKQRSADSARGHLLRRHGWTVEELFADDVFRTPRRVDALRRFAEHLELDPRTLLIA